MSRSYLAVLLLTAVPSMVEAAKVKVWHHQTPGHYDKAKFVQAVLTSEGKLQLARQLEPLAKLDATHVWDLIEDRVGNLIAATGNEGKIYKVSPHGKVSLLYTSEDAQVLCLTQATDGTIYAGTGPSGKIIRIDNKGEAKVFASTGESYVWSLALDTKSQTLYAGTGPRGRICKISSKAEVSVYYTTKQEHILCVATGADGTVYAGTDKNGLVYRIDAPAKPDAPAKGFVLHQAPQSEVCALEVTPEAVYVGTSAPTKRRGSSSSASNSSLSSALSLDSPTPGDKAKSNKTAASKESDSKSSSSESTSDSKESKGSPASAPSAPSSGENSVYRIAADGTVREVFRDKVMVLSLLHLGGRFLVGTGMEGQLFEVNESTKERSELARLDHGQILSLCRRADGSIVVGTGDPGKLYVLREQYAAQGTVTSEVLDAKMVSKWGALRWQANTPEGTRVTVAVRSGNVAEPDDTWSDWSEEETDGELATVKTPNARYLQYRVSLQADSHHEATPSVRAVSVRYTNTNVAPEITKVEVPDLNAVNLDNPRKVKIKWSATDANEDEVTYSLLVRKETWTNWVVLEEDLDKTDYEWDTTTTPSGVYQVKVVASDRRDNEEKSALTGERVSVPFVVCHTPPSVSLKVAGIDGDKVSLEATAASPLVRLTSASFVLNGKKSTSLFPADGLFDSKARTFRFQTERLKPGTYVLVMRVRDAAGNTGSSDVVFTVQPKAAVQR